MRIQRFRPGQRWRQMLALTVSGLILALFGGFVWFVTAVERVPGLPEHADGIVALTGGPDRVTDALRLLSDRRADRMLVTGIGGGAPLHDLALHAEVDTHFLASRITLGRGAASTHGNATETAAWVRENNLHSLIIVTACYHMPRAIVEMARALPGVQLYPAPVSPPSLHLASWNGLRLLGEEYGKFLAAWIGLTDFESDPGPLLSAARTTSGRT